jgi:putative tricarboxylic transport membrane protein
MKNATDRPAASRRALELVVSALIFVLGVVVMLDSLRLGARWAEDGPQPGYFPFYIAIAMCLASAVILLRNLADRGAPQVFVTRAALIQILRLLVPSVCYVMLIKFIGIYIASSLFIGYFMRRLGRFPWATTVAVAFGVSAAFFLLFEVWFKLPLPKGPLESWLGLD